MRAVNHVAATERLPVCLMEAFHLEQVLKKCQGPVDQDDGKQPKPFSPGKTL
jgi:hypothetical protein